MSRVVNDLALPIARITNRRLRRVCYLIAAIAVLAVNCSWAVAVENGRQRLILANGDHVDGSFVDSETPGEIYWQSSIFEAPLRFPISAVSMVTRSFPEQYDRAMAQAGEQTLPAENRIITRDHQDLVGRVVRIDEQSLTLESKRHGTIEVRRDQVKHVDGDAADNTSFDGTGSKSRWQVIGDRRSPDHWTESRGMLRTTVRGANLFHRVSDAKPVELNIELSGTRRPEFQIALGASEDPVALAKCVSVETWLNDLIIFSRASNRFHTVKLGEIERDSDAWSTNLRILYDPRRGYVQVWQGQRVLGEFESAPDDPDAATASFLIRNRGGELKLGTVRSRQWFDHNDGNREQLDLDRIWLRDGGVAQGRMKSLSAGDLVFAVDGQDQTYSWSNVRYVRLADAEVSDTPAGNNLNLNAGHVPAHNTPAAPVGQASATTDTAQQKLTAKSGVTRQPSEPPAGTVEILYRDGSYVRGEFLRSDVDGMWLKSAVSTSDLYCAFDGFQLITNYRAQSPTDAVRSESKLVGEGIGLSGRLANGASLTKPSWQPIYSEHAVVMSDQARAKFDLPGVIHDVGLSDLRTEVVMSTGDVLPCDLIAVGDDAVTVRCSQGDVVQIPRHLYKGSRTYGADRWIYRGFVMGDEWTVNAGVLPSLDFLPGQVSFRSQIAMAREFPLPDRFCISMDVEWFRNGQLTLGVGATKTENVLSTVSNLNITRDALARAAAEKTDDVVMVTVVYQNGRKNVIGRNDSAGYLRALQRAMSGDDMATYHASQMKQSTPQAHVDLYVDRAQRRYSVWVDGREEISWEAESVPAGNFIFLSGSCSVPAVELDTAVRISNFRVGPWAGWLLPDEQERFLTRRVGDTPDQMTHVLRAANGDSLRGRLVKVENGQVLFESRLDTMSIPLDAVLEIIELSGTEQATEPASADANGAAADGYVRLELTRYGQLVLTDVQVDERQVVGQLTGVGRVSIPRAIVQSIELGTTRHTRPSLFEAWRAIDPAPLPTDTSDDQQAVASAWLDKEAPNFKLGTLDGNNVELASLRGK
ncbi:MAG: hypothetical protein KDB23_23725, partial [Planctomycetales bacterium]|nr:hypothetical protein [Planctomycetales bacterium]